MNDVPLPFSTDIDVQRRLLADLDYSESVRSGEHDDYHEHLYGQVRRLAMRNFVQLAPYTGIGISAPARKLGRNNAVSLIRSGKMPDQALTIRSAPVPHQWLAECVDVLVNAYPKRLKRDEIADIVADSLDLNQHQCTVPSAERSPEYRVRVGKILGVLHHLNLVRR